MWIGYRKEIPKLTFQVSALHFGQETNWLAVRIILPAWFDHLADKEVQIKTFCTL